MRIQQSDESVVSREALRYFVMNPVAYGQSIARRHSVRLSVVATWTIVLLGCGTPSVPTGSVEPQGSAVTTPSGFTPTFSTGMKVSDLRDACRALTGDEIGMILGVGDMRDAEVHSSFATSEIECEYSNGLDNFPNTYARVELRVEHDPDGQIFEQHRYVFSLMDPPIDVPDIGDQAFRLGDIILYTQWGEWCIELQIGKFAAGNEDLTELLYEVMRRFLSRFPRSA